MNVRAEVAGLAFIVSVAVTPIVSAACKRFGILDHPGPLKIHRHPIPRLGGVAVAIAIASGSLAAGRPAIGDRLIIVAFVLGWFTGLLDDVRSLSPFARLVPQILAALLLWHAGAGPHTSVIAIASLAGEVILVVACVNSFNFLDGSDGLASGVGAIVAVAFFLGFHGAHSFRAALALAVAAACCGFLVWNFPPAKVFLGDSGSTLIGFAIALMAVDFYRSNRMDISIALFPPFAAALPLMDAGLAIIRRLRHSQSPLRGDRLHVYDLMLARGLSPRWTALVFFALTFIFSGLGLLALFTRQIIFLVCDAAAITALLVVAVLLGALGSKKNSTVGERQLPQLAGTRPRGSSIHSPPARL